MQKKTDSQTKQTPTAGQATVPNQTPNPVSEPNPNLTQGQPLPSFPMFDFSDVVGGATFTPPTPPTATADGAPTAETASTDGVPTAQKEAEDNDPTQEVDILPLRTDRKKILKVAGVIVGGTILAFLFLSLFGALPSPKRVWDALFGSDKSVAAVVKTPTPSAKVPETAAPTKTAAPAVGHQPAAEPTDEESSGDEGTSAPPTAATNSGTVVIDLSNCGPGNVIVDGNRVIFRACAR